VGLFGTGLGSGEGWSVTLALWNHSTKLIRKMVIECFVSSFHNTLENEIIIKKTPLQMIVGSIELVNKTLPIRPPNLN